jgi:HK97 family phage portal protein
MQDLARNDFSLKATLREVVIKDKALKDRVEWVGGSATHAGISVTGASAMRYSAVFACVHCISWDEAALPLPTYEKMERGKRLAPEHYAYKMLHDEPNPEQTAFQFRSSRMVQALVHGNGYAEIEFARGYPSALWPIPYDRCQPMRTNDAAHELFYRVMLPDGTTKDLPPYRILHLAGLSMDGDVGMSVIRQSREGIGLGMAAEQFGARFYGQGANVSLVAMHPGTLSLEASNNLQARLSNDAEGLGRSHRILLLEEDMKVEKMSINPQDAQFLELRQFQIEDLARMFRVPPHKIGHLLRATFSNIEEQNIEYYTGTQLPWLVNWEQEIKRKLFTPWSGDRYFAEHNADGLLRGNTAQRYLAYNTAHNGGWLSVNEIREKENMNPIEGGDIYLQPLNMGQVGDKPADTSTNAGDTGNKTGDTSVDDLKQQVLQFVLDNIADREVQNLARAIKKYAGQPEAFDRWVEDCYRDFGTFISDQFHAVGQEPPAGFITQYSTDSRALISSNTHNPELAARWRSVRQPLALAQISKK